MKHTHRQTRLRTLTDLYKALDRRHAVTLTYQGRKGEETVRTVELHELRTTADGDITLVAMCRMQKEERNFLLSSVTAYTVHRIGYVLQRPEPTVYERPSLAPAHDAQALFFHELARGTEDADYQPRRRLTQTDTDLAA
ncbi:WYL domain-containing protein [Streptomyces sp. NPDC021012]|uniref:WYL domain-containing protein n=1 Tax=Streptomyces sp. NPDC021012 TaxID=3365107 RepID=UPI0037A57DA1